MESIEDYEAGLAVVMSGYSEAAWDELRAAKVWPPGTEHMKCYRNFSIKELKDKVLKFYRAKGMISKHPFNLLILTVLFGAIAVDSFGF